MARGSPRGSALCARRFDKDFDELRDLLDDIAHELKRFTEQTMSYEAKYHGATDPKLADFKDAESAWRDQRDNIYRLNARLVIRLGRDHVLVDTLGSALGVLDRAGFDVGTALAADEPLDDDKLLRLPDRVNEFWAGYEAYLDAAQALVGSPVVPPPARPPS